MGGFLVTKLKNRVDWDDRWWGTIDNKSVDVKKDDKNWKWTEKPAEERGKCKALMKKAQAYDTMKAQKKKKKKKKKKAQERKEALEKLQNTQPIEPKRMGVAEGRPECMPR